jgi:hypothetical protein
LCTALLPDDNVLAINYYTARISARPENASAPTDQLMYLRALRTIPNLSITFGHFLTHSVRMALTGVGPVKKLWVDKTEEKGSDVNLAAHLIRDASSARPPQPGSVSAAATAAASHRWMVIGSVRHGLCPKVRTPRPRGRCRRGRRRRVPALLSQQDDVHERVPAKARAQHEAFRALVSAGRHPV